MQLQVHMEGRGQNRQAFDMPHSPQSGPATAAPPSSRGSLLPLTSGVRSRLKSSQHQFQRDDWHSSLKTKGVTPAENLALQVLSGSIMEPGLSGVIYLVSAEQVTMHNEPVPMVKLH